MDSLKQLWACLTCSWKGAFGTMICGTTDILLHCPRCTSADCAPADGKTVNIKEWHGDKPAVFN